MLLEGKNAIVYGGGGAMGGAIARAFAREGATVYLAGRTLANLEKVAQDISAAGGRAETAEVDAHDAAAVEAHVAAVEKPRLRVDRVLHQEPRR
jgi:NAD(P)-dependent dehydrogenase (short-subunit alcohol dehydrogenase family)